MYELLNRYPLYFPSRNDPSYTLKDFLKQCDRKHQLPTIVNITSLNNDHGRAIKGLLSKTSPVLLLEIHEMQSILAECHRFAEGARPQSYRHRLTVGQSRMPNKASTRFRSMKKLSRSLVSLASVNGATATSPSEDDLLNSAGDEISSSQRDLMRRLTEKRSSAIPLCRIPLTYGGFFELLNENDRAIEPCRKLSDLIRMELDETNPSSHIERWPQAFLLRASCIGYVKKSVPENLASASNLTETSDSCYGSTSDLDTPKNVVVLADEGQTIPAGQVLTVLNDCYGLRTRICEKEQHPSASPSSGSPSPTVLSWSKGKSLLTFWKKRRQSQHSDTLSTDSSSQKSISGKTETYLKCRLQQGDIIYLSLDECGLFSPVNSGPSRLKSMVTSTDLNISGVFSLKNLLSSFRFPISVRLPDVSLSFENLYAPAVIHPSNSSSPKLRLLMPYDEQVVFACPLHLLSSKSAKGVASLVVIPLSINADIQVQPCLNMSEIVHAADFVQLVHACLQIIEQYRTDLSLIHFPLQLTNKTLRHKQPLYRKRSQSISYINHEDKTNAQGRLRYSDEQLNKVPSNSDESSSFQSSPLRCRESVETIKQKLSSDAHRQRTKGPREKPPRRLARTQSDSDDEKYHDVDKIYDYVRSGDITDEVQKIQDKELAANKTQAWNIPSNRVSWIRSRERFPRTRHSSD